MVSQEYSTRAGDVYVIIGNSALMKCDVPSFVADFVSINSWVDNQGQEHFATNNNGISNNLSNMGHTYHTKINRSKRNQNSHFLMNFCFSVVTQSYISGAHEVYVIVGNSALVKCEIPSFVADFVAVVNWIDNEGNEYFPSETAMGTLYSQFSKKGTHKAIADKKFSLSH